MMRHVLVALYALIGAGVADAGCEYPYEDIAVPNGRIATHDEMIEAQKAVKAYVARIEEYLACLEPRTNPTPANVENPVTEREARINSARYDAAIDKMEDTADEFNEALRQYRER